MLISTNGSQHGQRLVIYELYFSFSSDTFLQQGNECKLSFQLRRSVAGSEYSRQLT